MNTDIDSYSQKDILSLLKLRDDVDLTVDYLTKKVESAINTIKDNLESLDDPDKLINFFKKAFMRIAVVKGFEISEDIRSALDLDPIPNISEQPITDPNDNQRIETVATYAGALPPALPVDIAQSTAPLKYTRGLVNPVEREIITTQLVLNSRFRNEYAKCDHNLFKFKPTDVPKTADYTIELETPYTDVVSLKLASVQMLNSYYPISEHLGTNEVTFTVFIWDESPNINNAIISQSAPITLKIADGNYSVISLRDTFNTIFTTGDPVLRPLECVYHELTGRLYFKIREQDLSLTPPHYNPPQGNAGYIPQWGININWTVVSECNRRIDLNLGWMLGYRKLVYTFFDDYNKTPTLQNPVGMLGEAITNLIGTPYFLLEVDDFNNNNPAVINYNCPGLKNNINSRNLLAQIPNAVQPYSVLFEDSSDRIYKTRNFFGPVRIRRLRIRLLDDAGRTINLHGGEFSITLEITSLNKPYKSMVI